MQILFIADIHIKLGQKDVPVVWARNRYTLLIAEIKPLLPQVDLVVIGGDVFDKLPTMEELEVYYDLVVELDKPTLILPGNHESVKKDTTFFTYLKGVTNRLNNKVVVIDDYYTCADFDIIPYNRLKDYEKNPEKIQTPKRVLFTHVRGEIPPHVKPEVDLAIFDKWEAVLAGDLHSYDNCQRNILYPGSPVTTSFHRSEVDTGVIIFDTNTLEHRFVKLNLPQLIRKTVKVGEPMEPTTYHHTMYEVEGDMAELGALADSDLISKKLLKRDSDTALMLDPGMTLQQELKEYLLYILQLPEESVEEVLHLFNDNANKIELE